MDINQVDLSTLQIQVRRECSRPPVTDEGPRNGQGHFWSCHECNAYSYRRYGNESIEHLEVVEWVTLDELKAMLARV
jgi:hypothetical protein